MLQAVLEVKRKREYRRGQGDNVVSPAGYSYVSISLTVEFGNVCAQTHTHTHAQARTHVQTQISPLSLHSHKIGKIEKTEHGETKHYLSCSVS